MDLLQGDVQVAYQEWLWSSLLSDKLKIGFPMALGGAQNLIPVCCRIEDFRDQPSLLEATYRFCYSESVNMKFSLLRGEREREREREREITCISECSAVFSPS